MATMRFLMMLFATLAPAAVLAAPAQRLSDEQVEQVLAEAAAKREAAERAAEKPKIAIHGEVGVEVGTGGSRAAYGTAFVPLGAENGAVLSFSTATEPDARRRRDRR